MSEYKFYYFPLYGRGEPIRMLLTHAQVPHENIVVTFQQWPEYKPGMPNLQMPALEMGDGKRIGQSNAILRFLGMRHGYYPKDPMEAYKSDMLCDAFADVGGVIYKPHFAKPEEKDALIAEIFDKLLPKFLDLVEPICNEGHKFLVGDTLTCADFWIGGLYVNYINNSAITFGQDKFATCLDNYPGFKAYSERFVAEMADYLSKRPACPV